MTTVMANLGLDKALRDAGVRTVKTQVGDRYVLEEMQRVGANLGGEQSGHLLFLDHSTTGDGIASALHLLGVMRETGQPLSELAACMVKFPQVLVNVRVKERRPFDEIPGLADRVSAFEAEVNGAGGSCSAIRARSRSRASCSRERSRSTSSGWPRKSPP